MGAVEYRRAVAGDAAVLASLRAAFLREVSADEPVDEALIELMRAYFAEALANGEFAAVVGCVEGEIVATSGLVEYRSPPSVHNRLGRSGYILNMYTVPAWRGKGIAGTILGKVLEMAAERGYCRVSLHALDGARGIYERAGFEGTDNEMRRDLRVCPPKTSARRHEAHEDSRRNSM